MEDESEIEEDLDENGQEYSSEDQHDNNKKVFKAAKSNPVLYEDRATKQ
jgi:hypothetical protein